MYLEITSFIGYFDSFYGIVDETTNEIVKCPSNEIANEMVNESCDVVIGKSCDLVANTKYKTMEKKVKPMATLLPRNNDILRKGVCQEPMLREPGKIGHVFNKDTMDMLQVGSGDFLLEEEKDQFKRILQRHGKAFAFSHT